MVTSTLTDEERLKYIWTEGYDEFLEGVEYTDGGSMVYTFVEDVASLEYYRELGDIAVNDVFVIYEKGNSDTRIKSEMIVDLDENI